MLFPDVTCRVPDSLQKNMDYGIYDLVAADYVVVVTIYRDTLNIHISGTVRLHEIDEDVVFDFLEGRKEDFIQGVILSNFEFRNHYFHMTSKKEAKPFIAFTLICRKGQPFIAKDLRWLDIYGDLNYRRVLIANEAAQEKNFYRSIWNSSRAAIFGLTPSGQIIEPNPEAVAFFHLDANQTIHFSNIKQSADFFAAIRDVMEHNCQSNLKDFVYTAGNAEYVLDMEIAPLQDSKDRIVGVVVVVTDITDRRLLGMEVELLRQYGLLGEIAIGLAHDIKNPLMSIRGCGKLLARAENNEDLKSKLSHIIAHEVDRINEVVDQMMEYGRLPSKTDPVSVNVNAILEKCSRMLERLKLTKDIRIALNLDSSMPHITAREIHVQQVFSNLLINAMQAIQDAGEIQITSRCDAKARRVLVSIRDDGIGIPENIKDQIFNPYFTTKETGSGMGLFIVKRTLSKYSAGITVESEEGKGTYCEVCFTF